MTNDQSTPLPEMKPRQVMFSERQRDHIAEATNQLRAAGWKVSQADLIREGAHRLAAEIKAGTFQGSFATLTPEGR